MENTIYVGGLLGNLSALKSNLQKDTEILGGGESFAKIFASVQTDETANVEKSTADMTMDEYKSYLAEKLSAIPWHPNRFNDEESITITDSGWEALKNNPDYEKEMLDGIAADRSFYSPLLSLRGAGTYCTRVIGASMEEYQGWSWSKEHGFGSAEASRSMFDTKSKDSFMTLRAKKTKMNKEIDKRYYENRRLIQEADARYAAAHDLSAYIGTGQPAPMITGVPAEFLLMDLM